MLEFLLSHGANANTRDREDGITLLHIASECNNVEAANILISHGANINDNKNDRKYTPLMVACIFDSKEIAKLLISNGANVNMQDYIGRSPLHAAVLCNDTKAEDAEEKNSKFNRDNKDLIELLLSNGADVNAKTVEGYPPLHMASYASKLEIVEMLVSHGAEINTLIGRISALDIAIGREKSDYEKFLKRRKAGMKCQVYLDSSQEAKKIQAFLILHGGKTNIGHKN